MNWLPRLSIASPLLFFSTEARYTGIDYKGSDQTLFLAQLSRGLTEWAYRIGLKQVSMCFGTVQTLNFDRMATLKIRSWSSNSYQSFIMFQYYVI